ncbi:MAG: TetR/AcrR family transcriptional regulator [Syntrophobacter sp.]
MNSDNSKRPVQDSIDWSLVEKFHPGIAAEEQRTKFRIFFAAAKLFSIKGYNGTAVREIVEAAGVTKPALYYYFSNKEDLFVQLIDMALATFAELLHRSLAWQGSPRERLVNFFSEVLSLFENNIDLIRLVNIMIYAPKGAVPPYDLKRRHDGFHSAMRELLLPQNGESLRVGGEELETALLLLIGLFRSLQIHLVIPDVGAPLSLDQITRGIDVVLAMVGMTGPEVREG